MRDFYIPKYRNEFVDYLRKFIPMKILKSLKMKDLIMRYYGIRYSQR